MKKVFLAAILALAVISCKDSGMSSGSVKTHVTDKLADDDQKAAYAIGSMIGQDVKFNSQRIDNFNEKDFGKGLTDFFKQNEKSRNAYALGQSVGMTMIQQFKGQNIHENIDEKIVIQAIMDVLQDNERLFPEDSVQGFLPGYLDELGQRTAIKNKEKGEEFLAEKKKDSKVKATDSGLLYEVLKEGEGESPNSESVVEVNYEGKLINGEIFDQSAEGEPIEFPLKNVIKGWQEGLQLMKPGAKYRFYIPSDLAYGETGAPGGKIGPNETLTFEVELLSVKEMENVNPQPQIQIQPETGE